MDPTAIQGGLPPGGPSLQTGVQEGQPRPAVPTTESAPKPRVKPQKSPARRALEAMADLRITVALFALSLLLVYWGTWAQKDAGIWTVVNQYFRSAIVWIPLKVLLMYTVGVTAIKIPYPGGWTLGTLMMINLLAAHSTRFKLSWNRSGIMLLHAGIVIMMLSEVVTGMYAIEGQMHIREKQASNSVIHPGTSELAVIRTVDSGKDEVAVVPARMLKPGAVVSNDMLPFDIEVKKYFVNSQLKDLAKGEDPIATRGLGLLTKVVELEENTGVDTESQYDAPSAYVTLKDRKTGADLGTLLLSMHLKTQWVKADNVDYQISLRFKESHRPFTFYLEKFEHKKYPGTEKPKDFRSTVQLVDKDNNENRTVEIYMNAPFRYRGETFYQQSWLKDNRGNANGTVLQVVRNPGWLLPYISCAVVCLGMMLHFGMNLIKFLERRNA